MTKVTEEPRWPAHDSPRRTTMRTRLRDLEGRLVFIALADGSRLDSCQLVSSGRGWTDKVWLFANGRDVFIRTAEVTDVWEPVERRRPAA
jgi:hypothetical protein